MSSYTSHAFFVNTDVIDKPLLEKIKKQLQPGGFVFLTGEEFQKVTQGILPLPLTVVVRQEQGHIVVPHAVAG